MLFDAMLHKLTFRPKHLSKITAFVDALCSVAGKDIVWAGII